MNQRLKKKTNLKTFTKGHLQTEKAHGRKKYGWPAYSPKSYQTLIVVVSLLDLVGTSLWPVLNVCRSVGWLSVCLSWFSKKAGGYTSILLLEHFFFFSLFGQKIHIGGYLLMLFPVSGYFPDIVARTIWIMALNLLRGAGAGGGGNFAYSVNRGFLVNYTFVLMDNPNWG